MAFVTFFSSVNMSAVPGTLGTLNQPTSTSFTITGPGTSDIYGGSFTYAGNSVAGTVTSVTTFAGGAILERITGLSLDAATIALDARTAQTQALQSLQLAGDDTISALFGKSTILAQGGNDHIALAGGGNTVDGGAGTDTVVYTGNKTDYTVSVSGDTILVTNGGVTDSLVGVERIKFADTLVAFDLYGNMGEAYRLYSAAYNRAPDKAGLSFWTSQLDQGISVATVAQKFVTSAEFQSIYGSVAGASTLVNGFYTNVLGRAPDATGLAYWMGKLLSGMSAASALTAFADSAENIHKVEPVLLQGVALDPSLIYV